MSHRRRREKDRGVEMWQITFIIGRGVRRKNFVRLTFAQTNWSFVTTDASIMRRWQC